jgi:hypothetical protein
MATNPLYLTEKFILGSNYTDWSAEKKKAKKSEV